MIKYEVEKTGGSITLKTPTVAKYVNDLNEIKYENNLEKNNINVKMGKTVGRLTNIALKEIYLDTIESDTRQLDLDDIVLTFKIDDETDLDLELPETLSNLESSIAAIQDPRYFILNNSMFKEFVNCVLFDLAKNNAEYKALIDDSLIKLNASVAFSDSDTLEGAVLTLTVTDNDNTPVKGARVTGSVAEIELTDAVTGNDGTLEVEVETTGDKSYDILIALEGYEDVKVTGDFTVATIQDSGDNTGGDTTGNTDNTNTGGD